MKQIKKIMIYLLAAGMLLSLTGCENKETSGPASGNEITGGKLTNTQVQQLMDNLGLGLDVMMTAGSFEKETVGDPVIVGFSIARQKQSYQQQFQEGAIDEPTYKMMTKQFFDYEINAVSKKYFGKTPVSYETPYSAYHPETQSLTLKNWPFSGVTKTVVTALEEDNGFYTAHMEIYHFAEEAAARLAQEENGGYQASPLGVMQVVFRLAEGNPRYPAFERMTYTA